MNIFWRRAMALGRVVPARRAIAASSAREGDKSKESCYCTVVCVKSRENPSLYVFLIVDRDSDLKNRRSPGHF